MLLVRFFALVLLCTLTGLQPLSVQAQDASLSSVQQQPTLSVAVFRDGAAIEGLSAAQVAGSSPDSFSPFNSTTAYHATDKQPIWLRLRVHVPVSDATRQWTVNFSKPFTDKVVLHLPQTDGRWTQQSAGDWIAHQRWAKKSLAPQFDLPLLAAGTHDFYVAVYSFIPVRLNVQLLPTAVANQVLQSDLLWMVFILGAMVFMVLASLTLFVAYRRSTYAWYGAYAASVMMVIASFTGLGSYLMWSESTHWPEISIGVSAILAAALQLQFCRAMFLNHTSPKWLRTTVNAVLVANVIALITYIVISDTVLRTILFTVQPAIFSLLTVTIATRALMEQRSKIAALWLVAYAPLIAIYSLSVIEHLGYASLPWLPYNAPVYAFAFEMPLLLIALHLHAKTQHTKTVRDSTLDGIDPMTGFVTSRLLPDTIASMWDEAQSLKHDIAVAYVEVKHSPHYVDMHGTPPRARTQERAVRMLRTVAREHDTIAHVDKDIYALIMPRMSLGTNLSDRLSRLIALGIMTDKDGQQESPLRFHIAASTARSFAGNSKDLSTALTGKLEQNDTWGQRPIRFVRKISQRYSALASAAAANETLSHFWHRAADADIKASTQRTLSLP
jgi:two-component system, sensor histidine kinase LadS